MTRLTASLSRLVTGRPPRGARLLVEAPPVKDTHGQHLYSGGGTVEFDQDGRLAVDLLATDTFGTDPATWAYTFTVLWDGGGLPPFTAAVTGPLVDLADLQPMDPAAPVYLAQSPSDVARAMRRFHVALADAATTPVNIGWGPTNSIGDGFGAPTMLDRCSHVFLTEVRRSLGLTGGLGYVDCWNQPQFPDHPLTTTAQGHPWTATGLGRQAIEYRPDTYQQFTLTGITGLDLVYTGSADSRVLTYVLTDAGGTSGEVKYLDTAEPVARGGYTEVVARELLPDATYLLSMARVTGGNPVVEGLVLYNGDETSGVRMFEAGQSGYRAADYVAPHDGWADSLRNYQPALVVLPILSNDWASGRTPDQGRDALLAVIEKTRSVLDVAPSILLVGEYDRAHSNPVPWDAYRAVYADVAANDPDVAFVDFTDAFGPYDGTNRGGLLDPREDPAAVHPSKAGHRKIGLGAARVALP